MDALLLDEMTDYMPGTRLEGKPRIQSKSLIIMYLGTHIPKREYEEWITKQLADSFSVELELIAIHHKSGTDHLGTHKYTYVILCLNKAIRTWNIGLFSWKRLRSEIRTLKNLSQVESALDYLQDWKYFPPSEKTVIAPSVELNTTATKTEESSTGVEIMYTSDRPLVFYISDFLGWQTQVVLFIDKLCKPEYREEHCSLKLWYLNPEEKELPYPHLREEMGRSNKVIHVVSCDNNRGNTGVTTFFKAIKYPVVNPDRSILHHQIKEHNANRYLIIIGIPNHLDYLREADIQRKKGWTGECVIFDATREKSLGREISRTLEEASDEPTCSTVWLFTKSLPNPDIFSSHRWLFYGIDACWIMGSISNLRVIERNYAIDAYSKQS